MNNFSKLVFKTKVVLTYCQALSIRQLHRNYFNRIQQQSTLSKSELLVLIEMGDWKGISKSFKLDNSSNIQTLRKNPIFSRSSI